MVCFQLDVSQYGQWTTMNGSSYVMSRRGEVDVCNQNLISEISKKEIATPAIYVQK
jgi:hypothetical protein